MYFFASLGFCFDYVVFLDYGIRLCDELRFKTFHSELIVSQCLIHVNYIRNCSFFLSLTELYSQSIALFVFRAGINTLPDDSIFISGVELIAFNSKFDIIAVLALSCVVIHACEVVHFVVILSLVAFKKTAEHRCNEDNSNDNYYNYNSGKYRDNK